MKKKPATMHHVAILSLATLTLTTACGKTAESKLDIVGGRRVTASDAGPEKVSTVGLSGCTGTIIAKDLVLTAAHCYDNSVQGGYVLFGIQFNGKERKIVSIESALVNPSYTGPNNDVAMLKLKTEIPAGYKPIKLLPSSLPLVAGEAVRQAGYGSDNQPNSFGTLRTVDSRYVGPTSRGGLSVRNGQTAACSGDSGGPLYVQKNGEWYTAGITSTAYMDQARRCIGGNEYASVSQNYGMILDMAKRLTGRANPLDTAVPAPKPEPDELDPNQGNPQTNPARFQVLSNLAINNADLSVRVKNISARPVKDCLFTLSPVRSFWNFYEVSYDLTALVKLTAVDQEVEIHFNDPYAANTNLSAISRYTLKKTCTE